ncbi:YceI family protein [Cognaticolwellia mytili]|uniref:YceI family protein n=1 Tax=Cognaticolwellia mytili TaxID=1888913 RepID=UPI000A16E1A3|nr:YceI family protein [Cognaticolwellia mytili]
MIKKSLLLLILLSGSVFATEKLTIIPELSSVSFATIKKQYVIEPAVVDNIQGEYSNNTFNLAINFKHIKTNIPIRNSRVNDIFLKTNLYPLVKIKGYFEMESIVKPITKTSIKADVDFYGQIKTFEIPVIIHKSAGLLSVNSYKPTIVKASDFGIPTENLISLAATVGGISISDTIPLNINLTFSATAQ